jgi:transcriptional regulator with XRE-family HTH domain
MSDSGAVSIGMQVKLKRIAKGLRQSDVARELNVAQQEVSAVEAGRWNLTESEVRRYLEAIDALPDRNLTFVTR